MRVLRVGAGVRLCSAVWVCFWQSLYSGLSIVVIRLLQVKRCVHFIARLHPNGAINPAELPGYGSFMRNPPSEKAPCVQPLL